MAINFPTAGLVAGVTTYRYGVRTWLWTGTAWQLIINPAFGYGAVTTNGDLIVTGSLTVNGTTSTLNSNTLTVDDKNIELGSVISATGFGATLATGTAVVTLTTGSTVGMLIGQTVTKTSGTGVFGASPTILSIQSTTQLTLSVNHATAGAIVFSSGGATNATANGGGITLKGATDKTIIWDSSGLNWTSNQDWNITGTAYKISGTSVLTATTLGSAVVASSLTSVGTLTTLNIAAGSTSVAPLKFTAGVSLLTIPLAGAIEYMADGLYATANPGSTTTGPGRGLVSAPQMVFSLANSTAATTTTPVSPFAAGNDVLSVLEAAKLYRFSGKYYFTATFTSGTAETIQTLFVFSNAQAAIKYTYKLYDMAGTGTLTQTGTVSAATATSVSPAITASKTYVLEFDGYFTTHPTLTSSLTPQFQMSTTGTSTTATAGSWFQVEKLGTATTTLIAGNWA